MNPERFLSSSLSHGIPKIENPLSISWHDSSWIPVLNPGNVMDYFSERTNPFYDRTCNNESLKMQRLGTEHLCNLTGLEYCLLHVQEPILYVIRKQHRHSPNQVTPIADYYILAGVVYQAPDLASIIGSRLLTMVHHFQLAFDEAITYSRYHPSKGYWWEFKDNENAEKSKSKEKAKEEPGSVFQRRRVDVLLTELAKNFPPKLPSPPQLEKQTTEETTKTGIKTEPPAEKSDQLSATSQTTAVATTTTTTVTATTCSTTSGSLSNSTSNVTVTATTAVTTSTTVTAASVAALPSPATSTVQRTSMKPPPEKKPRLA